VHPLRLLVGGALLVFLDVRVDEVDLLPDLVGVPLVVVALLRVRRLSRWVDLALAGAIAMAPEAVADLVGDEDATLVGMLSTLGETALVFGTCSALVVGALDGGLRRSADRVRWIDLALAVPALGFLVLGPGEPTPVEGEWAALMVVGALVVFAVAAWWLTLMWRATDADLSPGRAAAEPVA
jgi:hypothetical protein